MNKRMIRLVERRERLVAQAAAQRVALAQNIEPWRMPLARIDQGLAAVRFIRSHPVIWMVGGAALLAALRHCGLAAPRNGCKSAGRRGRWGMNCAAGSRI